MIPPFAVSAAGLFVRHWKLAVIAALLIVIAALKLSLADEQRRSARLEQRLAETVVAFDRFKADVATRTALAKAQDAAHARRVERDQILVNQETLSAYQKEIALLRGRAAAQRLRSGAAAADPRGGGITRVSGPADTSNGVDGASGEDGLSPADALIASEIAVRLKALQGWVQGQSRIER